MQTFGFGVGDATFVCGRDVTDTSGPLPQRLISGYYVTASHTFIIAIRMIDAGILVSLATRVAAGPTNEYPSLAGNVFLPMVWAQFPGGGGLLPQCNDGDDNDGDQLIDFPSDPECTSPTDNDESRR